MEFLEMVHVVVTAGILGLLSRKLCCGVWTFSSEQTSMQHLLKINFVVSSVLSLELQG